MDTWIVIPNHIHAILWIEAIRDDEMMHVGATGRSPLRQWEAARGPAKKSLGSFIAGFKAASTKRINQLRRSPGDPVWQRNYYDRIIRDDDELTRLRRYILENPQRWEFDRCHGT